MHITWKNLIWNDRAAKYFITSTRSFLFEAGAEVSDFSSYFYLLLKNLNYLNSLIRQKSECAKKNASYPIPITNRDVYLLEKILRDCDIYKRRKKNYVPVRQIFLGLEWQISEFSTSRFFYPSRFFTHLIELVEMSKKLHITYPRNGL